jgi:hypothetical protein
MLLIRLPLSPLGGVPRRKEELEATRSIANHSWGKPSRARKQAATRLEPEWLRIMSDRRLALVAGQIRGQILSLQIRWKVAMRLPSIRATPPRE